MDIPQLHEVIGDTDIYLIDQILKGRYKKGELILDAGCGSGRNMHWFLQNDLCIYGIDEDAVNIIGLKEDHPLLPPIRLQAANIEKLPFGDDFFHHIIASAVLHFAKSTEMFFNMVHEIHRVLKPNGTVFIRMTSDIGIEEKIKPIADGVYYLPDDSTRFLLTRPVLKTLLDQFSFALIEPLKTVNVNDVRCMTTLVMQKIARK